MDTHGRIEGLTADAVAQAHEADLKTQEQYRVKYLRYWFDEQARSFAWLKHQIKRLRLPFIGKRMSCCR
jgi:hypothetical protein